MAAGGLSSRVSRLPRCKCGAPTRMRSGRQERIYPEDTPVKQFVRRTLRRFGVDIVRLRGRPDLMGFVKDRSIDLVIDVGANVGQFGERLRAQGYRNRIIS